MKNQEKCLKNKILELPLIKKFNQWNPKYKAMFIVGLIMAAINLSSLIVYFWWSIEKNINSLKQDNFYTLLPKWTKENPTFRPDALALMWSNTLTFTMISNWILTINLIVFPFLQNSQKAKVWFFTANVLITITFSIYWSLIFPTYFKGKAAILEKWYLAFYSTILHAVNPAIGFVFLGLVKKDIKLRTIDLWKTNIFVICYFTFALITFFIGEKIKNVAPNADENVYKSFHITIYDFLNFKHPLFYGLGWAKKSYNLPLVVVLDIVMFLVAFFLTPALAYLWKAIYKIEIIKCNKTKVEQSQPMVQE
ncbi:MAGa3780 family membrane protein [Mycoplasmopsis hyopharyngis]|uniref:MAGa3780 family membrane protein n=1 Tax=Mycoplasmopsis hyopharyngis TaxID=29558 RepID=UPI003873662A